jgi:hypothetical protein
VPVSCFRSPTAQLPRPLTAAPDVLWVRSDYEWELHRLERKRIARFAVNLRHV